MGNILNSLQTKHQSHSCLTQKRQDCLVEDGTLVLLALWTPFLMYVAQCLQRRVKETTERVVLSRYYTYAPYDEDQKLSLIRRGYERNYQLR